MRKIKLLTAITISVIAFYSCSKDKDTAEPEPTPTPTPVVNVLCDGNGSTSFYPLVVNNSWIYSYKIATQTQSTSPSPYILGTIIHDSISYFKFEDPNYLLNNSLELRIDPTSKNIYSYSSSSNSEFLYIPGSPTINQVWNYSNSNTRKVTNLSASINTASCSYTGLLEISQYNSSAVLLHKEYYKKGIGMVQKQTIGTFNETYTLKSITLK